MFILNEAREGVYARAMIASGNWVLPEVPNHVENGEIIPDKPPLFHWIAAVATWTRALLSWHTVEGRVGVSQVFDEWSLRFPSALTGCLTIVGLLWLGPKLVGRRAALLSAAACITSWQFVNQARYGRVDMCLACFTTWAILLAGIALVHGSSRALLGAAVASGLAVLSKGPIGVILPVLVCAIWAGARSARERSARWLLDLPWIAATCVFALIVLPWYVAAWRMGGDAFVRSQLLCENLDQFTGGNGRMAFSYYLGPWLSDSWPWNLVALLSAREALRTKDRGTLFCLTWWVVMLLCFQASAYKRGAYLLPAVPAGSLLAGRWLDGWIERRDQEHKPRTEFRFGRWAVGLLLVGLIGAAAGAFLAHEPAIVRLIGRPCAPENLALVLGSLCATLWALPAAVRGLARGDARSALMATFASLFLLFAGAFTTVLSISAEAISPKPLVARLEAALPDGQDLTVFGLGDDESLLLLFHAREPERFAVVPAATPQPRRWPAGYYLLAEAVWEAVASPARACGGSWHEILRDELHERGRTIPVVLASRTVSGRDRFQ